MHTLSLAAFKIYFSWCEQFDSDACFSLCLCCVGALLWFLYLWNDLFTTFGTFPVTLPHYVLPIVFLWSPYKVPSGKVLGLLVPLGQSSAGVLDHPGVLKCEGAWSPQILYIFPSMLLAFFWHDHFSSSPLSLLFFVHMVSISHKFYLINLTYLIWWASCWSCLLALFVDFSVDPLPFFLHKESFWLPSPFIFLNTEMGAALEFLFTDGTGDIVGSPHLLPLTIVVLVSWMSCSTCFLGWLLLPPGFALQAAKLLSVHIPCGKSRFLLLSRWVLHLVLRRMPWSWWSSSWGVAKPLTLSHNVTYKVHAW